MNNIAATAAMTLFARIELIGMSLSPLPFGAITMFQTSLDCFVH